MLDLTDAFLPQLVGWSVVWVGASVVGLWVSRPRGFPNSFWFMTGLWCCVNIAIAAWSMPDPPESVDAFRRLLLINVGLGPLYLVCGVVLVTRRKPMPRSFGLAILVQGSALLAFDLVWWRVLAVG